MPNGFIINAASMVKIRCNIYDAEHRQALQKMTIQNGLLAGKTVKEILFMPNMLHAYEYHRYYCCNPNLVSADGFGAVLRDPQLSILLFEFNVQVLLNSYTTQVHMTNYQMKVTPLLQMECYHEAELASARARLQMHLFVNHNLINLLDKRPRLLPSGEPKPDEFTLDEIDPFELFIAEFGLSENGLAHL